MGSFPSLRAKCLDRQDSKARRSFHDWLVICIFCLAGITGVLRMTASIVDWYWLNFANIHPGPLYLVITGGLWGLLGLVTLVWLGAHLPWWRMFGAISALLFAGSYWADRLLFNNPSDRSTNLLFTLVCTLMLLAYIILVLHPWTSCLELEG